MADDALLAEDEVRALARLASLELDAAEIEPMRRDLARVLGYVRKLEELDVSGVAPTAHVQLERLPLRADEPRESLPHELAVREAPVVAEGGFAVPAFVDEG
jgi:aspartyl-tRNA(Asn)/glutamyl-tRNA(Gln) amidotransferase subunit C